MITQPQPRTRKLTIIAQDPSVTVDGKILTARIDIPAEEISPGPKGYRVNVIDYDVSTGKLYQPLEYDEMKEGKYPDPFEEAAKRHRDKLLLENPQFHQQNVYAIVMKTLARFEFALGRRINWAFPGHQLYIAPHAFADANAFYSKYEQALVFGYFQGMSGATVFSCLSHDVVAHETTHALLDGLRERYTDPSSPEQAGFHEGFADIVALLSVFSLPPIVARLLGDDYSNEDLINPNELTEEKLKESILFGMAEQMGQEMAAAIRGDRGTALRRSIELPPLTNDDDPDKYEKMPEYQEPHRRGEILVAAVLKAFLGVWLKRIERLKKGRSPGSMLDRLMVVEQGSDAAEQLLTMCIRAIDYAPPTDLQFCDFLSALLTADREAVPDDSKYGYREIIRQNFADYGLKPPASTDADGAWKMVNNDDLTFDRSHFESMLRDPDEVFRFIWENRETLKLDDKAYTKVISVRPCLRVGPDGFTLRETVAEYIQMLVLTPAEVETFNISTPAEMPENQEITLYGGGALVFDEYGRLKYHARNRILNAQRQTRRLKYLWDYGFFDDEQESQNLFARLHLQRSLNLPSNFKEKF